MLKSLGATGLLLAGGATTAAARPGGVAAGDARFRVGHFSPDAPPVDVYVNGDPFPGLQGVPFGVLSDYFTVPAGTYQVEVTPAGDASTVVIDTEVTPAGDASTVVIDTEVTLRRNRDYTVAATGVLADIAAVVLADTNRPAPYGKASVRVAHFSPDAPEVDIVVKDGPTLFSGLAFGDVSDYETVPAGTYDLQVVLSSDGTVVLDLPGTTLEGGRTYSVFAIGFATGGSPGFSVLPVVDAVSPARDQPTNGDVCRVR
ncbi:DUF4397 domain-containing protein [Haloferax sulfurifontis]|uniref:DUF4397 domain-containing protein n=1 Tax=Haloferax sulfurifontis ATCC BAA-897 TaxID=662480 RepID=M0I2Q7_9EURY|nr:DUF4397 domain-containing protein [Haloferax sulfurifontis]ELZ91060.1 hypothetical protein C441_12035 [Haloferax sulfurifontis ATCC BAA-897]